MSQVLDSFNRIIQTFYDKDTEDIKLVLKYLRLVEIFKNKSMFILEDLNYFLKGEVINQEEYDLMKEVLL